MELSVLLPIGFLLLSATGAMAPICRLTGIRPGWAALAAAGFLLLQRFPLAVSFAFSLNPASLLLLGFAVAAAARDGMKSIWIALGCGAGIGLLMLLIARLLPFAPEPALLPALLGAGLALILISAPGSALLAAAFAPFLMELGAAALELYAFGYAVVSLGSEAALNIQIAAVFLALLLLGGKAALAARRIA